MASNTRNQSTIDLGAYLSVAEGYALAIQSVDFIYQDSVTFSGAVGTMLVSPGGGITAQLTDLNPGTALVKADNQSLIASSALNIDSVNNIATHASDLYPDSFPTGAGNKGLSDAFMVVNDTLYLVAGPNINNIGATDVYVTARIRAKCVKLQKSDWIALAIQGVASDN